MARLTVSKTANESSNLSSPAILVCSMLASFNQVGPLVSTQLISVQIRVPAPFAGFV